MLRQMDERIAGVRRFNRYYTRRIGVLSQGLLDTPYSLSQARVLFEIAQQEPAIANDLISAMGIDAGYLSRILRSFERDGLIKKERSSLDGRQWNITLTDSGRQVYETLNRRSQDEVEAMLDALSDDEQSSLVDAMNIIERILHNPERGNASVVLRPHRSGDIGWIIWRHGAVYAREYGFNESFETRVAEILVEFSRRHDPKRERCWLAEIDGRRVGSVLLVDAGQGVAQLRLLLVEPTVRGVGVGKALVRECVNFARQSGYSKMKLWTQSNLIAARRLYSKAGFRIVEKHVHKSFGQNLVGEYWEIVFREG